VFDRGEVGQITFGRDRRTAPFCQVMDAQLMVATNFQGIGMLGGMGRNERKQTDIERSSK
jgi:hypothetical protein